MNVKRNLLESAADEENVDDEDTNIATALGQKKHLGSQLASDSAQNDVKLQSKKMVLNFSEQADNGDQKTALQNK